MNLFNVTAQVYKNDDPSKQNLLINETLNSSCPKEALSQFKLQFPTTEYSIVKILSVEEIPQVVA